MCHPVVSRRLPTPAATAAKGAGTGMSFASPNRRAFGMALIAAALPGLSMAAPADVLERPAAGSVRATSALMLAVAAAGRRLVAVGERGIVLLSDDDGRSWHQASVPVSTTLTAVHFADAQNGWAVGHGGVVLHSADAGQIWLRQLEGRQVAALTLAAAQALPPGSARAAAVRDAEYLVKDGPDKPLFDVRFRNANEGIVVGSYGMALGTSDGGKTWHSVAADIPNTKGRHINRIAQLGQRTWIVGEQGTLFTAGAGEAFVEVPVAYNGTLFGMLPLSATEWLVYGLRGNVLISRDAGHSWAKATVPEPVTITAGVKTADGLLLADLGGRLLASQDGLNFKPIASAELAPINAALLTADKALVLATVRGMVRIDLAQRPADKP